MYLYTYQNFVTNIIMSLKILSQVGELDFEFQNQRYDTIFLSHAKGKVFQKHWQIKPFFENLITIFKLKKKIPFGKMAAKPSI